MMERTALDAVFVRRRHERYDVARCALRRCFLGLLLSYRAVGILPKSNRLAMPLVLAWMVDGVFAQVNLLNH